MLISTYSFVLYQKKTDYKHKPTFIRKLTQPFYKYTERSKWRKPYLILNDTQKKVTKIQNREKNTIVLN